jgi:iron complex outermembrane receptor protein
MPINYKKRGENMQRTLVALAALGVWGGLAPEPAAAQSGAQAGPAPVVELPPVVVTGNPLGSQLFELAAPVGVLYGERLRFQLRSTLGETLAAEPGITSSYFGPNASRPIIRGLDGERIRILANGAPLFDASGTSADHAVAIEPLLVERVEVVRGPAAILYGSSAVGGVVNAIDQRIPQENQPPGVSGALEGRLGSVDGERSQVGRIGIGLAGGINLHFDAFDRRTADLRIPGFARSARRRALTPLGPGETEAAGRLPNSSSSAHGGAIGGSWVGSRGYLGASYSRLDSEYGVVAEPGVRIDLRQERVEFAGELRSLGWFESVRARYTRSDYAHTELEDGMPGTQFRNRGKDLRIEGRHRPLGPFEGVIGVQSTGFDFSALGAHAFLPHTRTRVHSLFVFEQARAGALTLQAGARVDRHSVEAEDDPAFGAALERRYTPRSVSLGAVYALSPGYVLALNASRTQRAPNYQELYADGEHVATGTYQRGDRALGLERSSAYDLSLRRRAGRVTGSVGVYQNRFENFIGLLPTGVTDPGSGLEIFQYTPIRAVFRGAEGQATIRLVQAPYALDLELRADSVRATHRETGEPLPRVSPLRYGAGLAFRDGAWSARLEVLRVTAQHRVAANELPTDGYTMVNAALGYRLRAGPAQVDLFLRGVNLLDAEARNHASLLKDIAPLGRRGALFGIRAAL